MNVEKKRISNKTFVAWQKYIREEWTVFRNLLSFFGDKEQSVELLIMKVLFSFKVSWSYCRKQKLPLINSLLRN